MDVTSDHNAILKRVARARLGPLGLIQKGRSRIWFDDHRWFVTMVEFQPSSYNRGSYLNAGASWLWWPEKDFLSFDQSYRIHGLELASDGDWEATCGALADQAAQRCLEVRREFCDVWTTSKRLNGEKRRPGGTVPPMGEWDWANAGVAAALSGDATLAHLRLEAVHAAPATSEWERVRQRVAGQLLDELGDLDRFREGRIADIQRARQRERLPELHDEAIRSALAARADQGDAPRRFVTRFGGFRSRG